MAAFDPLPISYVCVKLLGATHGERCGRRWRRRWRPLREDDLVGGRGQGGDNGGVANFHRRLLGDLNAPPRVAVYDHEGGAILKAFRTLGLDAHERVAQRLHADVADDDFSVRS